MHKRKQKNGERIKQQTRKKMTSILAPGRKNRLMLTTNSESTQQIITRTGFSGMESNF